MEEVLNRAIPLVDMVWEREVQAEPLNSPEAKAGLKSRIFAALKEIQHDDVRAQYQSALLDRFDAEFGRQKKSFGGKQWNKSPNRKASPALKATMQLGAIEAAREKRLIGAILEWPELLERVDETLFELQFRSPQAAQMQRTLLSYWRVTKAVEKSALNAHIASEGLETLHREFARDRLLICLLYTSPSPRDATLSRMPSSA